jgi:hypothetical protein
MASEMGKKGGQKSVESRFKGKSKEEIAEEMRKVRYRQNYTVEQESKINEMCKEFVKGLNKGASE